MSDADAEEYASFMRVLGRALLPIVAIAAVASCASGPKAISEPSPSAIDLPSPGFTPVFLRDSQTPSSARASERARCIDAELDRRDLNSFGDQKGTTYREGAPVGVKTTSDRYHYVLRHNPGIGTLCTKGTGEPDL